LLKIIAGLDSISEGDLYFGDRRVTQVAPAKRGVAMVFQSYALYPHMTVAENMTMSLRLAGVPKAERMRKAAEVAEILQLGALLDRKPAALSGGQRQRVAIGRALVRKPDIFLFDEPLSNLDAALRVETRVSIAKLHRALGNTMIYVTHDQVEAMTMADRIVILDHGQIAQVGTPMKLYDKPANMFVAGFIGSPKMNFLQVTGFARTPAGALLTIGDGEVVQLPFSVPSDRQIATIGIRPEHLAVMPEGPISGRVVAVEQLGSETLIHVERGLVTIVVKAGRDDAVRAGDVVRLGFDPKHVHCFDENGVSISSDVSA
jgi:multiple sugar transport system ATP-binding protein